MLQKLASIQSLLNHFVKNVGAAIFVKLINKQQILENANVFL